MTHVELKQNALRQGLTTSMLLYLVEVCMRMEIPMGNCEWNSGRNPTGVGIAFGLLMGTGMGITSWEWHIYKNSK